MFIVFEGGEGVGKSTQIELVYDVLQKAGHDVVKTREPGGTILGEKIRNLFKEETVDPPNQLAELYLICAARAQHVEQVIRPSLSAGKIVLCDRFLDSTYVYQGILGGLSKSIIDDLTAPILKGLIPDLTIIFNCDLEVSIKRIVNDKNRHMDRMDVKGKIFHQKVLLSYESHIPSFTYPCNNTPLRVSIDANGSMETFLNFWKLSLALNKS